MERDIPCPYSKTRARPDYSPLQRLPRTPSPVKDLRELNYKINRSPFRNGRQPIFPSHAYIEPSTVQQRPRQAVHHEKRSDQDSVTEMKQSNEPIPNRVPEVALQASGKFRSVRDSRDPQGSDLNSNRDSRQKGNWQRQSQGSLGNNRKSIQIPPKSSRHSLSQKQPNLDNPEDRSKPKRKIFEKWEVEGQKSQLRQSGEIPKASPSVVNKLAQQSAYSSAQAASRVLESEGASRGLIMPKSQVVQISPSRRPSLHSKTHRIAAQQLPPKPTQRKDQQDSGDRQSPLRFHEQQKGKEQTKVLATAPTVKPFQSEQQRRMSVWSGQGQNQEQPLYVIARSQRGQLQDRSRDQGEQAAIIRRQEQEIKYLHSQLQALKLQNLRIKSGSDALLGRSLASENRLLKDQLLETEKKIMYKSRELQALTEKHNAVCLELGQLQARRQNNCEQHIKQITFLRRRIAQLQGQLAFQKQLVRALELSNETKAKLLEREQSRRTRWCDGLLQVLEEAQGCYKIGEVKARVSEAERQVVRFKEQHA